MRLVLGKEISQIDSLAMSEYGLAGLQLMENAGRAVASKAAALSEAKSLPRNKDIAIFAGGGNNGGDALVAARHLANMGYKIKLFLLSDPSRYQGDALYNWQIIEKLALPYLVVRDLDQAKIVKVGLFNCALIIDGIFGTGFRGEPNPLVSKLIETINSCGLPILAIDVPSGVDANTGGVAGVAILADYTVTFGWAKLGLRLLPARDLVGQLEVIDISLPKALVNMVDSRIFETDRQYIKGLLPKRQADSHKGNYGHTVIVGGSANMFGAPILAAGGSLKIGSGLVTLAGPKGINVPLAARYPEAMNRLLPTAEGGIAVNPELLAEFAKFCQSKVVAIGMGMGRLEKTQQFIQDLLQTANQGLVIDADALGVLAKYGLKFRDYDQPVVLTPHPGEMALLLGQTTAQVQADRLGAVSQAARMYGAVVVLKGANTLIADGQNLKIGGEPKIFLNPTGNPGMAKGGSGDVLAGIIGGLLAQGLKGYEAAAAGVYIHGLAGDLAAAKLGEYGMTATDISKKLPEALVEILAKTE